MIQYSGGRDMVRDIFAVAIVYSPTKQRILVKMSSCYNKVVLLV